MEQMFFGFFQTLNKVNIRFLRKSFNFIQKVLSGSKLDLNSNKTVFFFLMTFVLYQINWKMRVDKFSWLKLPKK